MRRDLLETRPVAEVVAEIKSTLTNEPMAMYHHWLYVGMLLPENKDLPPTMAEHFCLEHIIERKIAAWNDAVENDDPVAGIEIITERPYRFQKFIDWDAHILLDQHAKLELLRDVWIDTERPHVNRGAWARYWNWVLGNRHHMSIYTMAELNVREQFDNMIPLYRGIHGEPDTGNPGLSWTTSRERAEWFARRWQGYSDNSCWLLKGSVKSKDVIGPFTQRGEDEIIVPLQNINYTVEELT